MNAPHYYQAVALLALASYLGCSSDQTAKQASSRSRSPDYSTMSPLELLELARQRGLNPAVNLDGTLNVENRPDQQDLVAILLRQEDQITALMDPDAPLRKNLPGTWIETNEQAVRPTVTIDTSLKKLVIERNRTYHESHVSSTSTGEKLIWSVAGSYHGNWNVKNSVLQLEISSADNPLLFLGVATGLLGHYYRISQITETTLILEDLGSFAGDTEVLRRLTLQRL